MSCADSAEPSSKDSSCTELWTINYLQHWFLGVSSSPRPPKVWTWDTDIQSLLSPVISKNSNKKGHRIKKLFMTGKIDAPLFATGIASSKGGLNGAELLWLWFPDRGGNLHPWPGILGDSYGWQPYGGGAPLSWYRGPTQEKINFSEHEQSKSINVNTHYQHHKMHQLS